MVRIFLANEDYAELSANIIQESFRQQAAILELNPSEYPNYAGFETADRVRMRMQSGDSVILLFLDGIAVGTVSYQLADEKTGYVKRLGVLPAYRGNDYGRLLTNEAEKGLLAIGASKAEVSIVAQFERLQNYYESMGYKVFARKNLPALPFEIAFMDKPLF
jgi:GNAT superfamily N-acetyltransferase